MIRLIGTDLDGTLLRRDKTLSPHNEEALRRAAARGVQIVPVTGRPLDGLPDALYGLIGEGIIRYAVTSNGAHVYELDSGGREAHCILRREMAAATVKEVLDTARREADEDLIMEIFAGGRGFHDEETRAALMTRFHGTPVADYLRKSRTSISSLDGFLEERGVTRYENISIMLRDHETREKVAAALERIPGILVLRSWITDLEVIDAEADKGTAMLWLARRLGIAPEETMAMGDGGNDRELLESAGWSVAMKNSVPELLEIADAVTEAGDDDGAALAIEKFVLGDM